MREARDLDLGHGGLPVTVGVDDDRRVVAELEAHPLARGLGPDAPAHLGRAREGDERDIGVVHEGTADARAAARDDLQVCRGKSAFLDEHAREQDRRERRLHRGLEDDRAARGDCRTELVSHEVEREVEGRDRANDPDRHPQDKADLALARGGRFEGHGLAGERACDGCGELHRAGRALGFGARGPDGLSGLPCDAPPELVTTLE